MACFAMTGMLVACLSVFWLLPALLQRPAKPLSSLRCASRWHCRTPSRVSASVIAARWTRASAVLIAIPGWWQLRHDDDVHLLIAPPLRSPRRMPDPRHHRPRQRQPVLPGARADSIEQTLQREEALEQRLQSMVDSDQLQGWLGLAGMVPSLQRQRRIRRCWRR
jgi:predicted exporter